MAALQTIRDRAGILVSIIIGVALLAFVIGDAISSGSSILNSKKNNIGEIDGDGISILAFQSKLNEQENSYKARTGQAITETEQAQLREQVWQEMIFTTLLQQQAEELGISVADDELFDLTYGKNISPVIYNMFGTQNPEEIRSIVQYLIQNPQAGISWNDIQSQVATNRIYEKYSALIANMFYTTSVEKSNATKGQNDKYDISYIVKRYTTIPDSTIKISDAAVKEYYNKHPQEQTESREIVYVAFDILPTTEDRQAIAEDLKSIVPALEATTTPESVISINSYTKNEPLYLAKDEIANTELADYIFSGKQGVYGPYEEAGFYKISRGFDKKMLADSVRVKHILIGGASLEEAQKSADSIMAVIKSNKMTFDEAARVNSMDQNSSVNGGDLGWLTAASLNPTLRDAFFGAKKGSVESVQSGYGVHIFEVVDQTKAKEKIKVATIDKEIRPSATTEIAVTNVARDFANGVKTLEELNEKAQGMNITRRSAILDKNDPSVNSMSDSRELVQQTYMSEDAGKIISNRENSTVFAFGNSKRVIAVLTKINEEGVVPFADRAVEIRHILANKQKAEQISKELKGIKDKSESLISIQNQSGLEIKDVADVTFSSMQLAGAGIEPAVIGTITTMNAGEISEPIEGTNGVYIVMVNNKVSEEPDAETLLAEEYRRQYMLNMKLSQQLLPTLAKQANVKDLRYRFY